MFYFMLMWWIYIIILSLATCNANVSLRPYYLLENVKIFLSWESYLRYTWADVLISLPTISQKTPNSGMKGTQRVVMQMSHARRLGSEPVYSFNLCYAMNMKQFKKL